MNDGTEKKMRWQKTILIYRGAYFFAQNRCLFCQDHFGAEADLSFGDVWLPDMKQNPIKHTSCLIHNEKGKNFYDQAVRFGAILDFPFDFSKLLLSQKRALAFKYNCAKAKSRYCARKKTSVSLDVSDPCGWNHALAFTLARLNRDFSLKHPKLLEAAPMPLLYYYMAFVRFLLNF